MYRKKEAKDRCLGRHWHLRDKQEKKSLRRRKGKTIRTAAGKWRAGSMHKQWMSLQDGQAEGLPLWSRGSDAYLPNARVPGSIPGQRTRTHRPQLRGHMPRSLMAQQMLTILRATTKNCCSQINSKMDFYKKWGASGEKRQRLPWISDCARGSVTTLNDLWSRGELGRGQGCWPEACMGCGNTDSGWDHPTLLLTQSTLLIVTEVLWIRDHYPCFID